MLKSTQMKMQGHFIIGATPLREQGALSSNDTNLFPWRDENKHENINQHRVANRHQCV